MKLRAIVLALALAACGQTGEKQNEAPAAPAGPDPFTLNIEIGRYGAMLGMNGFPESAATISSKRSRLFLRTVDR